MKTRIAELDAEKGKLEAIGRAFMSKAGVTNIEMSGIGKFILSSRKTWEYSAQVKDFESQVKTMKKHEEETGLAKVVKTSQFIRFTEGE